MLLKYQATKPHKRLDTNALTFVYSLCFCDCPVLTGQVTAKKYFSVCTQQCNNVTIEQCNNAAIEQCNNRTMQQCSNRTMQQ